MRIFDIMKHTIQLTTEELITLANDAECHLQNAIDSNVSRRILFYTNMRNKLRHALQGLIAQRSEQETHNLLVAGSSPAGRTFRSANRLAKHKPLRIFAVHLYGTCKEGI